MLVTTIKKILKKKYIADASGCSSTLLLFFFHSFFPFFFPIHSFLLHDIKFFIHIEGFSIHTCEWPTKNGHLTFFNSFILYHLGNRIHRGLATGPFRGCSPAVSGGRKHDENGFAIILFYFPPLTFFFFIPS